MLFRNAADPSQIEQTQIQSLILFVQLLLKLASVKEKWDTKKLPATHR